MIPVYSSGAPTTEAVVAATTYPAALPTGATGCKRKAKRVYKDF